MMMVGRLEVKFIFSTVHRLTSLCSYIIVQQHYRAAASLCSSNVSLSEKLRKESFECLIEDCSDAVSSKLTNHSDKRVFLSFVTHAMHCFPGTVLQLGCSAPVLF